MLRELHISNLAVIEDAAIDLGESLNCFTGQTGAGKSPIIGAFEVMLGLRNAGDLLRAGAEEGRVSGVFELHDAEIVGQIEAIADAGLDAAALPQQLLVTRKLFSSGRTSVSINGRPATQAMLREIGALLVDVHGQHDHQYLLKPAHQLITLDRFAECEDQRERFGALHRRLGELRRRRAELAASEALRRRQLELCEFQAAEIDEVEPTAGEYAELGARHKLLSNLERVQREAATVHAALYESDGAVADRLQAAVGVLEELSELDEELRGVAEAVRAALAGVQEASYDLSRYINRIDLDAGELEEVEQRLNALNRLIHKYGSTSPGAGGTLDDVLSYRAQIGDEIDRLRDESHDFETIDQQIEPVRREMMAAGRELSERRRAAATTISPRIEAELAELGMSEAKFEVAFEAIDAEADAAESASGLDAVEMLIQPNPGQPARPLRKIASGGELSRVMLAIKSIVASADRISVLVFDEIDANIGGRMGGVIGEKLRGLAARHQVLCITHLPQIAACADAHFRITKRVARGETRTEVERLGDRERRIDELAEMLSGKQTTATTRAQALEMLSRAEGGGAAGAGEAAAVVTPKRRGRRTARRA